MKKNLILIIFTFIILTGLLSGCAENKLSEEEEKFIGTWEAFSEYFQTTITMTFHSDGTFTQGEINRNWEVKNDLLVLTGNVEQETSSYNYYFSENNTKLYLQTVGTDFYIPYTKQLEQ
jgi:hypothetical protein